MRLEEEGASVEARGRLDIPGAAPEARRHRDPFELAQRVAATVGSGDGRLADALAAYAGDAACYEASVRGGGGAPSAGRMMIERATIEVVGAIGSALDLDLPSTAARWLELAQREGVPIIAGWDLRGGGERRCAKLYVNASDASLATRERLRAELLPNLRPAGEPPAVVGMNARADRVVETKLYVQSADAVALAEEHDERARSLAAAARDEGADAGGVLSCDVRADRIEPRAFFVALREPHDGQGWSCVRALPGYDAATIESLLPFPPAPPRSVGISLVDSPHLASRASALSWTLYFKPRDSGRAPEALEPTAIFRAADVEVGVFVEPTECAPRAFRRTERSAVSVRVRDGNPAAGALEPLVDWFTSRLRSSESGGAARALRLTDPPAPWHVVHVARQPR
jgi:hypothetical protein